MKLEYLSMVTNDNKALTSKKTDKQTAHINGDWHRAVHIWYIWNNKILMQKRSSQKAINPSLWDMGVAGHVDFGENELDTCVRESKEELNLDIDKEELKFLDIFKKEFKAKNILDNEFLYVYHYTLKPNDILKIIPQIEEVSSWKIIDFSDFIELSNSDLFVKRTSEIMEITLRNLKNILQN